MIIQKKKKSNKTSFKGGFILGGMGLKILYFTDSHIRGTTPKNRKDDFTKTLEKKFNEIVDIIDEEGIDFVIHGGDLFDRPDVSISLVSKFSKIINRKKIYLIPLLQKLLLI